jgi:ribosome-binding factor A
MKSYPRADRVAALILKVLSESLQKKVKDPRLEMAVITSVTMSRDIKTARIYYAVSGGSERAKADAKEGFQEARGYIKRVLAKQLGLRYMPDIKFFYDESIDYGSKIEGLIKSIHVNDGPDNTTSE